MKRFGMLALGTVAWMGLGGTVALAGGPKVSVGFNFSTPGYYHHHYHHRPWYPYYGPYYRPYYPVYVAPPPVIVQPAPVIQQVPVAQPVYQTQTAQPPLVQTASAPPSVDVDRYLQALANPDESVRADAVLQLGRLRAEQAVDPVAATLAGDRSANVREVAARALGLIGSSRGLPALQRAAQIDSDRDVRRSAQFATEVIQTRN